MLLVEIRLEFLLAIPALQVQTNFNAGCDLYVLGPAGCRHHDATEFRGNTELPIDRVDSAPGQACWVLGEPDCAHLGAPAATFPEPYM